MPRQRMVQGQLKMKALRDGQACAAFARVSCDLALPFFPPTNGPALRLSLTSPRRRFHAPTQNAVIACVVALAASLGTSAHAQDSSWGSRLQAELAKVEAANPAGIGVYVRDLDSGQSASYRARETWYLASTVKVPVAIAVLRGVEQGQFTLDTQLTLRAGDYVDGAGLTNSRPVGAQLSIRFLMEQMIIHSDNTASDMLIDLVGLGEVNALVESLVPDGFNRITSLADVRRLAYGNMTPAARHLEGRDLLLLKQQRTDAERAELLSRILDVPVSQFRTRSVGAAFSTYYASGVNSGRLDAYADLLEKLVNGQAIGPASTRYLLGLMERIATGPNRLKAGLPSQVSFAHKTGTQLRRTCDSGIVSNARPGHTQRVIVVACTRDEASVTRADLALRQVGAAICRSGLLTEGVTHAPHCDAAPGPVPVRAAADR